MTTTQIMRRFMVCGTLGVIAGWSGAANAEPPGQAACPRGPVSIYFATGDVTTSPQTQAVLGKVHEIAGECAADQVDIIAHVDSTEGESALALALERLTGVVDQLVSLGIPAGQIRVATDAPVGDSLAGVTRRQLDIRFGNHVIVAEPREDTGASRPRTQAIHSGEI